MMNNEQGFDYYYGAEADQFSFIRIPKLMILDPKFEDLSMGAMLLYGLLLDRMNLSMKHGWRDEMNRVYIRFKIEDIQEAMRVSETTATKYLKELEKLGLVEKKRMGLACGNILYVKNFISPDLRDKALITLKNLGNGDEQVAAETAYTDRHTTNAMGSIPHEVSKIGITKEIRGNESKVSMGNVTTDSYGYVPLISKGNVAIDSDGQNNNKINNNNYINIQSNPISDDYKIFLCYKNRAKRVLELDDDEIDKLSKYKIYKTAIYDQVNYDTLEECYPDSTDIIRNLIDVMVEIMMSTQPKFMISGNEYDADYVKSRVFCIFDRHIEYMIECIKKNTTKVGNIKAYLRATIFNCTTTLECYSDMTVQNLLAETYYA